MASMFSFRTRSSDRDRNTDMQRMNRLCTLAREIAAEVSKEREGLKGRRQREADSAAFLMEATANGDAGSASRLDTLSASIMQAEDRLAMLDRQLEWLGSIDETMGGYPAAPENA